MGRFSAMPMGLGSKTVAEVKNTRVMRLLSRPDGGILWTKLVIISGFFTGLVLSKHLWISSRHFPLIPVFSGLPQIPYPFDYACLAVMAALLVLIASSAAPRMYLVVFLLLLTALALMDQCRWQPWVYQYSLMLAVLAVFYWKGGKESDRIATLNLWRLIIASIYLYSGLQKLNPAFGAHALPHLLGGKESAAAPIARALAVLPAIFEAAIGLGLFTKKFRNISVIAAIAMHLFILLQIGPLGLNYNTVVWPWNVAMIAFDVILFWKTDFSFADVLWRNPFAFQKAILLLVLIMPFFSFFGWWDSYLSWALYTGNVNGATISCSDAVAGRLPIYLQKYVTHLPANNNRLNIRDWAMGELNVPGYPETRVYRRIAAEVCRLSDNSTEMALYVTEKTTLLGRGHTVRDTCFGTLVVH
jgi:hypothetical protein